MNLNNSNGNPEPIRGGLGASIMGPRNVPIERENPTLLASPDTDAGTMPNLKFSYAAARNRLLSGGWAREITERELPIATTLAGVNMRLKPGGIRELHWHKEAEWAYMLAGRARVTAIDQEGRNFIDDVGAGDIWNFPAASTIAAAHVEVEPGGMRELHWHPNTDEWQYYISGQGRMTVFASAGKARTFDFQAGDVGYIPFAMGHYIENTGDEPLRFLEVFRSDRFADISLSQWMALTPPELVQQHLNLDARTMAAVARARTKPIVVR